MSGARAVGGARPPAPPAQRRPDVTPTERRAIEAVTGPVAGLDLLLALRDGRGRDFQRLEFLGDSVLDLVLAVHAAAEPGCPGDPARLVTDHQLAEQARACGVGDWLEWDASDDRLADLVESCVAVAWRSGGWEQVAATVDLVVHPVGDVTSRVLVSGRPDLPTTTASEEQLGSAVLELAAAVLVSEGWPDAEEGELSQRRASIHRAERVAAFASRSGRVPAGGDADTVSNRVERWLARVLVGEGADVSVAEARVVLG